MKPVYTIIWYPPARDRQLGRIVREALERSEDTEPLFEAWKVAKQALENDPNNAGESRQGRLRVLIQLPFSIHYIVLEPTRQVMILKVHRIPPKSTL